MVIKQLMFMLDFGLRHYSKNYEMGAQDRQNFGLYIETILKYDGVNNSSINFTCYGCTDDRCY